MPIWIEVLLGLAAIALCAAACWQEDALVAWEDWAAARARQWKEGYYDASANPRRRPGGDCPRPGR